MTKNTHDKNIITDNDTGEAICSCGCGYVLEQGVVSFKRPLPNDDKLDSESRLYGYGPFGTLMIHDYSLSTIIPMVNTDHVGNKLDFNSLNRFAKLRRLNRLSYFHVSSVSVRMIKILSTLDDLCDKLNLPPSIKERSAYLVRKIIREGKLKSYSVKGICVGCIYLVCKERHVHCTKKQIEDITHFEFNTPLYYIRKVSDALDYKNSTYSPFDERDVEGIISSLCLELKINSTVEKKALQLYKEIDAQHLIGSSTTNIIAGSIVYLAVTDLKSNHHTEEIAEYLHIAATYISTHANEYARSLGMIIKRHNILYI